jgi:hypothetical protein
MLTAVNVSFRSAQLNGFRCQSATVGGGRRGAQTGISVCFIQFHKADIKPRRSLTGVTDQTTQEWSASNSDFESTGARQQ